MSILKKIIFFWLCLTILPNCKKNDGASLKGYVTAGVRWPNAKASVCWENPEAVDEVYLKFAEERVISEYNNRTMFKFSTNWQKCQPDSKGIRIVIIDSDNRRVEAFGRELDGLKNGMILNLAFKEAAWPACQGDDIYYCIADDALHEFGHAIGLRHEMNRRDSPCHADQTSGRGEGLKNAVPIGQYDPDSIMNYCASSQFRETGIATLSNEDVKVINTYYSMPSEDLAAENPRSQCEVDGGQWDFNGECCASTSNVFKSVRIRTYDYCSSLTTVQFPKINYINRIKADVVTNLQETRDLSIHEILLQLRCVQDKTRELIFSSNVITNAELLQGEVGVYVEDSKETICNQARIASLVSFADESDEVFPVVGYTIEPINVVVRSNENVDLRGSWVFNDKRSYEELSSNTFFANIKVKLPADSRALGKAARLNCDTGNYDGKVSASEYVGEFFLELNNSFKFRLIRCGSLEVYPQGSFRSSDSYYRLDFGLDIPIQAGNSKDINMIAKSFTTLSDGSFPICTANDGRGYGRPFKCGTSDCAKISMQANQSNDEAGWCLYRPK